MTSVDLAVLITARHRTARQALKAAAVIAARYEWHHLETAADMLCSSYESDERLLGLHLIRRYLTVDPNMCPALIGLVRSLTRQADATVATAARDVLEEIATDV